MSPSFQIQRLTQLFLNPKTTTIFSPQNLFQIHTQLITTGLLHSHPPWLLSLFHLYLSNPSTFSHSTAIFDRIQEPNSLKWRLMIRKLASDSDPSEAISLFRKMVSGWSKKPSNPFDDPFIYASLIKACNKLHAVKEGKSVHCHVMRIGLDYNLNIMNSLVHFYSNLRNFMGYACVLFDKIPQRTIVTVNCMLSGYVKNGFFNVALSLFIGVLSGSFGLCVKPNYVTLVVLISGCAEFGGVGFGSSIHSYCSKTGLDSKNEVCNVLIDMYTKFGFVGEAAKVFNEASDKDLISWNSMIFGYAKNNNGMKAFSTFREMKSKNVNYDRVSLISLISAATSCRDPDMGMVVHGYIQRSGMNTSVSVRSALINMYSKCGLVEFSRKVFEEFPEENIVSWNSMIHGYVECGFNIDALRLFDLIQSRRLKVDEITMLGLILACRNSGELDRGNYVHSYIKSGEHLIGNIVLCNALIDMYAKCGSMTRARALFDKMPRRDVISWTSIIVGYAINGDGKEALFAFRQMGNEEIEPNSVTFIGALLACDHWGLVNDGENLYKTMHKVYYIEPKIEHCGCVVDMYGRAGMLEEAYRFVKKMPVEPNAVVWRMLIHACRVHGHLDAGLSLVNGLIELKSLHGPEDNVISSNVLAEAGKWDDVLHRRNLMVANKASKIAGRSSISYLTE